MSLAVMLVRRPAGLSPLSLALAIAVGVVSGVYIWRPVAKDWADRVIAREKGQQPTPAEK